MKINFLTFVKYFSLIGLVLIISCNRVPKYSILNSNILPPISELQFFDGQNGICISHYGKGNAGHLIKTSNGGIDWAEIKTNFGYITTSYFMDINTGWVNGLAYFKVTNEDGSESATSRYGIFFTQNGGETWERIWDETFINDIFFIDKNNGWAVSTNNFIIHTEDGGKTWVRQTIIQNENNTVDFSGRTYNYNLKAVKFFNLKKGFIVGPATILFTEDGGKNWVPQKVDKFFSADIGQICDIAIASKNNVWLIGPEDKIFHYDGHRFLPIHNTNYKEYKIIDNCSPGMSPDLREIAFYDSNNGWVVGKDGLVFQTKNGGKTWKQVSIKLNENASNYCDDPISRYPWYVAIAPINENSCILYGYDELSLAKVRSVMVKLE